MTAMIAGVDPPYYVKLLGPRKTVDVWAGAWTAMLASVRKAPVPQ